MSEICASFKDSVSHLYSEVGSALQLFCGSYPVMTPIETTEVQMK